MKEKVNIGGRWVGKGEPTLIIAELGSNHDGKLGQARELIAAASESGADVIKFQVYHAESLYISLL